MKLTLPPGISPADFDAALKKFEAVVGKEWVLATDQDRDVYSDIYAPGSEEEWPPSAAVAPATTEEIQAIVRIANEFKTPLWPVSRGKNLGYGTAAPRMPGSVVLDLGRMTKIHEVDPDLAYCVVEPGVGFFDLYEHLQRNNHPLWLSVPGNAWGSVMGNALDHGIGYTPYGQNARNICGMEVVLPDGDLVRTGMGAMSNNKASHLFPFSYGPSWDQMFTQSNMGIVSKMGLWLMPAPETSLQITVDIPKEEDISWVIDTLAPLKINGLIDQSIFIPSWLGKMVLKGRRQDFWDKPGAIPEWRVQELLKEHNLGYWQVSLRFYGDREVVKARANVVKNAFMGKINTPWIEEWWESGNPVNAMDITMGVPSAVALQMGDWVGGRGAHMGFSPVVPASSKHVVHQLKRSRKIIAEHDVDFYASFTLHGRFANNVNMLMYDRDDDAQVKNIRKLFNALIKDARDSGYGEYRTHLGWMDAVADTFDFNDHAMRRLNEKVKDALDPNGIIAPGKQGIWPSAYRSQADKEFRT
ncbi:FAD-binding oxidoreductase [Emcibacter sp.]|uniref:FAD-binding oxidoreductase n=1 Tax=Emcibacter sp. TaxID=1979954 RepID=UPI002AA5F28E|nr:FAD-binding oxidoreductase [Emcibacter sp.]